MRATNPPLSSQSSDLQAGNGQPKSSDTKKGWFQKTWPTQAKHVLMHVQAPWPQGAVDSNGNNIGGTPRKEPNKNLQEFLEIAGVSAAMDGLSAGVYASTNGLRVRLSQGLVSSLLQGKILPQENSYRGYVQVWSFVRPEGVQLSVDEAQRAAEEDIAAVNLLRCGQGMSEKQSLASAQARWFTPKSIGEAKLGARHFWAVWKHLTPGGVLDNYWYEIFRLIDQYHDRLDGLQSQDTMIAVYILQVAQNFHDAFLEECILTMADGTPSISILDEATSWIKRLATTNMYIPPMVKPHVLKLVAAQLPPAEKNPKRKRDEDDKAQPGGSKDNKTARATLSGKVVHPERRDKTTAEAFCKKSYYKHMKQLAAKVPNLFGKDLKAADQACGKFHLKGKCYSDCDRKHEFSNAEYTAFWNAAKEIVKGE
jgi:hypothetical protein